MELNAQLKSIFPLQEKGCHMLSDFFLLICVNFYSYWFNIILFESKIQEFFMFDGMSCLFESPQYKFSHRGKKVSTKIRSINLRRNPTLTPPKS